jgi:hypothetical protein
MRIAAKIGRLTLTHSSAGQKFVSHATYVQPVKSEFETRW